VMAFFFSGRFQVISITPLSTLTFTCSVILCAPCLAP
jgi:hypothetical protein